MKFSDPPRVRHISPQVFDEVSHRVHVMRVQLQRVIILLDQKELTPRERGILDIAMEMADISQESVDRINRNEIPWPR